MAKKEKGKKKKSYKDGKLKITIEGPASAFERLRPRKKKERITFHDREVDHRNGKKDKGKGRKKHLVRVVHR